MSITTNIFEELLININCIIGLDGFDIPSEIEVDENDVNVALELIRNDRVGNGSDYNDELMMSMYFSEVKNMTSSNYMDDLFTSYENFLSVDSIAKYILARARENYSIDKSVISFYEKKLNRLNEYVRENGPMNVLDDCLDRYLEICYTILMMVGVKEYCC